MPNILRLHHGACTICLFTMQMISTGLGKQNMPSAPVEATATALRAIETHHLPQHTHEVTAQGAVEEGGGFTGWSRQRMWQMLGADLG